MKFGKRILAAVLVVISVLNSMPTVYQAAEDGFEIESISVQKKEEQLPLVPHEDIYYTNTDVTVTVTAVGTLEETVKIYFGEEDAYVSQEVDVQSGEDENYYAVAEFELSVPEEGDEQSFELKAYVQSSLGDSEVFDGGMLVFDMDSPNLNAVEVKSVDPNVVNTILNFFAYGIFSNNAVEIVVEADDTSIAKVSINDREMTLNDEGKYVLRVSADETIENMQITATDNAGWSTTKKLTELSTDDRVQSDNLYVENTAPTVEWTFSNNGHVGTDGKVWYGKEDTNETLTITVRDNAGSVNSGIYSIRISDNDQVIHEKVDFTEIKTEHNIEFLMQDFSEGEHKITVSAIDNAGNEMSLQEKTFYIDRTEPESEPISMRAENGKQMNGNWWFSGDGESKFRIYVSDNLSGVENISVKINADKDLIAREFSFGKSDIHEDDGRYYVEANISTLPLDESQTYVITGTVTDTAGNKSEIESLTVHRDLNHPEIKGFTIQKKSGLAEKILNILSFGIFTNDDFIVKAETSDGAYDSGIAYATIAYKCDGVPETKEMVHLGDGVFSYEFPSASEISYTDISVTVYDKFEKTDTQALKIRDDLDVDDVYVDQMKPSVSLELPQGVSVSQTDNRKWYAANKEITFSAQDAESGVYEVSVVVNDTEVFSAQDAVNSTLNTDEIVRLVSAQADGKYAIKITATDKAGNVSEKEDNFYVDKGNPVIKRVEFTPATSDGTIQTGDFIDRLQYGLFFKTDTVLSVYVEDQAPSAGLNRLEYRLVYLEDGVIVKESSGTLGCSNGKAQITIPKDFKGQVYLKAFDNVNNCSGEVTTKAYVVDNTKPTIQITEHGKTSYKDAQGNPLYVEENSFTVEITDERSGIKEIGYAQSSEKNSYTRKSISIRSNGYWVGDVLEDGWVVTEIENNLVTKVKKTFTFTSDDNDVFLSFDATDNALNKLEGVRNKTFTIDRTNPVVNVMFAEDDDTDLYYNENRVAYITIIDRNITPELVDIVIENAFGEVPAYTFTQNSKTEYVAVVEFSDGDYTVGVSGKDLGGHAATVNYGGGNERLFYVDKTAPQMEENFTSFVDSDTEDSFKEDKTVEIKITEHNFDQTLVNLQILQKEAGAEHVTEGFTDVTAEVLRTLTWNTIGDVHTASFTLANDGVYQVRMTPEDLAGNRANQTQTVVFEIDKTVPTIVSRNGKTVRADDTGYIDVYDYYRQDEAAPTIEFDDANIDHIKYVLTVYSVKQKDGERAAVITPSRVYLEEDSAKLGIIQGNKFTLPNFVNDGVYSLELTAVDKAGNESEVNVNTYVRLVNQEVLACIMDSDIEAKTGLYSFQYENGTAISKRPDNFEDIDIFVLAQNENDVQIVLRDNNGTVYNTNASATTDSSIYGMQMYRFTLESEYFKENFQSDTDIELSLSVINDGNRIDLGRMHIDNIAPTCELSDGFDSWKWYCSEDTQTITISNISELLDLEQCKVYDNGKEVEFLYLETDNSLMFTLEKGWHNVGIVLSDMAGNTYNIQEKTNIHIGFFWLWIIGGTAAVFLSATIYLLLYIKKKKQIEDF